MPDSELRQFIKASIRSVWALELLLLLRRRPRDWTAATLVTELRASSTVVTGALASLETAGLVSCAEGRCRYAPASTLLDQMCDVLERAYIEKPVGVINQIVSARDGMQSFADAFRLKDKPE